MPIVKEVKWGEDNPLDNVPTLTEEDQYAVKKRMEALAKIFAEEGKARYKLEVMFGSDRKTYAPTAGMLSFWESGAKLNGGGDTKMYICAGKDKGLNECQEFIPDAANGYGFMVCPGCKKVWKGDEVSGEIVAKLPMQGWAALIHKYYVRLEHNADIYVKHAKQDLQAKARLEVERNRGGELLSKSRDSRVTYIYPLRNIIKDTANGADLLTKIYQLLKA